MDIQRGDIFEMVRSDHPYTVIVRDITPCVVHFRYLRAPGTYSDKRGEMRIPIFLNCCRKKKSAKAHKRDGRAASRALRMTAHIAL